MGEIVGTKVIAYHEESDSYKNFELYNSKFTTDNLETKMGYKLNEEEHNPFCLIEAELTEKFMNSDIFKEELNPEKPEDYHVATVLNQSINYILNMIPADQSKCQKQRFEEYVQYMKQD